MTNWISDVLVQKQVEKKLGRALTAEEIHADEPFLAIDVRGMGVWIAIPTLRFPNELLKTDVGDYLENMDLYELLYA